MIVAASATGSRPIFSASASTVGALTITPALNQRPGNALRGLVPANT